jgi:hypothetical protein
VKHLYSIQGVCCAGVIFSFASFSPPLSHFSFFLPSLPPLDIFPTNSILFSLLLCGFGAQPTAFSTSDTVENEHCSEPVH